jgi:hypothetical protein
MKKLISIVSVAVVAAGCASTPVRQLTNEEIVALAKEGKTGLQIIDTLRAGRGTYDKSAGELVALNKAGVPPEVLDYLQQTQLDAIRRDEQWRMSAYTTWGAPFYRPWRYRPLLPAYGHRPQPKVEAPVGSAQ